MQNSAIAAGGWFDTNSLVLENLRDGIPTTELPYRTSGNRDCIQQNFVIRPKKALLFQSEISKPGCGVETEYGVVDEQAYLQRANTGVAGQLKDIHGGNAAVIPVPRTSDLLLLDKSAPDNTVYLHIYRDLHDSIKTTSQIDGSVQHRLAQAPTATLKGIDGKPVGVRSTTLSFSGNSEYMVAEIPGVGLSRIHKQSLTIQPFARFPLQTAEWQAAISNSGRYAAVTLFSSQIFRLYDLASCSKNQLSMHEQCQHVDLWHYMGQKVPGYLGVSRLKFINDESLDFYGTRTVAGNRAHAHYSLRTMAGAASGYGYLGLGDSFSSGEGAYNYRDGTDIPTNRCHTSTRSYPFLLGQTANLGEYNSIACSGAKIGDISSPNENVYNANAQSKDKTNRSFDPEIYSQFLPGYRLQRELISVHMPSVITLTAGGNDIGFADIVAKCAMPGTCYEFREEREQLLRSIDMQFDRLVTLYTDLLDKGQRDRIRIYVLGYPQLAKPEGDCAANVHLNKGELYFANESVAYLNSVIKQASEKAGVYYVDVEHALEGARFCETESWNVAVNGLTVGNGAPSFTGSLGPIANESYHPNAYGHWLLAAAVDTKTGGLTAPMPKPNNTLVQNKNHSQLSMIVNAPSRQDGSSYSEAKQRLHQIDEQVIVKNQPVELGYISQDQALAPNQTYSVELHSTPVRVGSFTTDSKGESSLSIHIPDTVTDGLHTLHVFGKNIAGEDIDLFKTVYVSSGMGQGECMVVSAAGKDEDNDGVDDACDAIIGQPQDANQIEPNPDDYPATELPESHEESDDPTEITQANVGVTSSMVLHDNISTLPTPANGEALAEGYHVLGVNQAKYSKPYAGESRATKKLDDGMGLVVQETNIRSTGMQVVLLLFVPVGLVVCCWWGRRRYWTT